MDDVVCSYDLAGRLQRLETLTGIPASEIRAKIFDSGFKDTADGGAYAASEYLDEISAILGVTIDREAWVKTRAETTVPKPDMLALARAANERCEIALLSNNCWLMAETLPHMLPEIVDVFESNVFVSAQIGASKTSPNAFTTLLPMLNWHPETTLFVDGFPDYLKSARSAGLQTHLFTDIEPLREDLVRLGVPSGLLPN